MLSQKRSLLCLIFVEFVVLGLLISSLLYALHANNNANHQLNKLIQQSHVSVLLADELRQSSEDLTRMVRLYAVTGDEKYRDFFYDILAIRHGEAARPEAYGQDFWALRLADDGYGQKLGEQVSLLELMARAGITEEEIALLAEAERRSDQLAEREEIAINARSGSSAETKNQVTLMDQQGSTLSKLLLFGPEYHQAKAEIMAPINDFLASVAARTKGAVQEMQGQIHKLSNLLTSQALFLTLFVALIFLTMLRYQKVTSATLQQSEERYRALHNASFGGIMIHDQGLVLDCNQALSDMTGYSHEELVGKNGLKLIADHCLDLVLHNIQNGFDERYEVEGLRKDGSVYPLSIKGKNVQYRGREARVIELLDITEQKRAENELRKSEMKQLAMIENIVDVIAIVDRDGINQYKSPNIEKIFGWRPEDVVGVTTWENIHPDDLPATQEVFATLLLEDNASAKGECRYRCKDGSFKWIEYTAVNCLHDSNISGVLLSYHDISERKKIAEQRIRSGQLSALGELAAGVAHEINNPITGVINYAQLLLNKHAKDEKEKKLLNSIVKEGNRIATIVRNLLKFAHKDRDSMKLITICEVVHEAVELLQQQLLGDGIFLEIDLVEDLPKLYGNAQKLEQVILNLVSNSRHALNERFPVSEEAKLLRISAEQVVIGHNVKIRLTMYDQGCGIPEHDMQRVFNRFFTTKPAGIGTGLGLSIVHDILDEHGATIEIESKIDLFTKIVMEFPAHE